MMLGEFEIIRAPMEPSGASLALRVIDRDTIDSLLIDS
jgi:hypothetical protein